MSQVADEYGDVSERADTARRAVAGQLSELLVEQQRTGGREPFAERVRGIAEAQRTGDPVLLRAAVMEAAVEAGRWAATLDLANPALRQGMVR